MSDIGVVRERMTSMGSTNFFGSLISVSSFSLLISPQFAYCPVYSIFYLLSPFFTLLSSLGTSGYVLNPKDLELHL